MFRRARTAAKVENQHATDLLTGRTCQRERELRVAIIFYSFPRDMGYSNTMLARYLARLGAEVHYIAADLPIYHKDLNARSVYNEFSAAAPMRPGESETYDGYTVHCIGHRYLLGVPMFTG